MSDSTITGLEGITAQELERELRDHAPITIVDVRDRESFDAWHITCGAARLANVPLDGIEADPTGALAAAGVAAGRDLRIICNRGNASVTATRLLASAGIPAMNVAGGMIAWSRLLIADEVPVPGAATVVQFRREALGCLSYLVIAGDVALVVDPAPDVTAYIDEAARRGVRITHILDTHVHADHLSGMRDLARLTGATMLLSDGAFARGAAVPGAKTVRDGDVLTGQPAELRIVGLPGHTSDNVGVLVDGVALIAGDSLFADSVARPDLEAGDAGAATAARRLHRTLHERVLPLGDDVVLLPCHYAGGRLTRAVSPTLGQVRRDVPLLTLDEDAFAHGVIAAMPPRPLNYLEIIEANMGHDTEADVSGLEVGANNCAATASHP